MRGMVSTGIFQTLLLGEKRNALWKTIQGKRIRAVGSGRSAPAAPADPEAGLGAWTSTEDAGPLHRNVATDHVRRIIMMVTKQHPLPLPLHSP